MREAIKRGLYNGIAASAILLAFPLAWRLGILVGSGHWLPLGDIVFPQR